MDRSRVCITCGRSGGPGWFAAHECPKAAKKPARKRERKPDTRKRVGRAQKVNLPALPTIPERPRDYWYEEANCRDLDVNLFYPSETGGKLGQQAGKEIRAVCSACVVRGDCLSAALLEPSHANGVHGWWGGLSPRQLGRLKRERRLAV